MNCLVQEFSASKKAFGAEFIGSAVNDLEELSAFLWLFASRFWKRFGLDCSFGLEFDLRVPLTWYRVQESSRHSLWSKEDWHIFGWNFSQVPPLLHPRGALSPEVISFGHSLGWALGQPFPDIPYLHVPLR